MVEASNPPPCGKGGRAQRGGVGVAQFCGVEAVESRCLKDSRDPHPLPLPARGRGAARIAPLSTAGVFVRNPPHPVLDCQQELIP